MTYRDQIGDIGLFDWRNVRRELRHFPPFMTRNRVLQATSQLIVGSSRTQGKCAVVTDVYFHGIGDAAAAQTTQLRLVDPAGNSHRLPFLIPISTQGVAQSYHWQPQKPIVVPAGWTLNHTNVGNTLSNPTCFLKGYFLDPNDAMSIGLDCGEAGGSPGSTPSPAPYKRQQIQFGWVPASATTQVAAVGIPGMKIEITDVLVRMYESSAATIQIVERTVGGGDEEVIFHFTQASTNLGLMPTFDLKPQIFTRTAGKELVVTTTGTSSRSSIIILGRYVPTDLVPGNAWYRCGTLAGTNADAQLLAPVTGTLAQRVVLKEAPLVRNIDVLDGVFFNIRTDTDVGHLITYSLTSGLEAAGSNLDLLGFSGYGFTPSSSNLLYGVFNGLGMPVPNSIAPDPQEIAWEMVDLGTATADGGIADMAVTIWGFQTHATTRSIARQALLGEA